MVLNLSDSYSEQGEICLNLKVQIHNINKGHSPELARRSPTLDGYETFTAKAREYAKTKTKSREEAIDQATEECIKEGVLVKYLTHYRSEVRNMWATEWKMEDALMVRALETKEDMAEKMLAEGMDVNTISRITGLSADAILRLKPS